MEKDPNGLDPKYNIGAKLDDGKPDMSLLIDFNLALREVAKVGMHGCNKYKRESWAHVQDGTLRYTAADLRHIFAESDESYDKDSGLLHAAHHAWNALARLQFIMRSINEGKVL
jgi:hypothetical protein